MFGVCSGVYFCPQSVLHQPPPHLLHSLVSLMHTCSVFLTEVHQPPGGGGNAWVAFWHAVCSWQLQDNHFKTPVKFPNKPFIDCQSGFTWVRYDSPPPPSSYRLLFPLLTSLADLTAVVLNFLPGYFQRIHLVLLRVRGWWEQCSHRHQILENKKTHLGKSGFVFLSVLGEAYIYCPRGHIVCVETEKGSINNNDKQLNSNQHVNNNCVSL